MTAFAVAILYLLQGRVVNAMDAETYIAIDSQVGADPSDKESLDHKYMIAYNCAIKDTLRYSEFSLMEVGNCANVSSQYRSSWKTKGQVLQAKAFEDISVVQCKMVASFYVAYCSYNLISGYRLWSSRGQLLNVQIQLSQSECNNALETKILRYTDRIYYAKQNFLSIDLSPSFSADGWMTLRGSADDAKGTCVPESFNLGRHHYPSHILTMRYNIHIKRLHAVFNTVKRLIRINEHLMLPNIKTGSYFSPTDGNFHWDPIPQGNLTENLWLQVAKGEVTIHEPVNINTSMPIAIVMAENTRASIAFSLRERTNLCAFSTCRYAYKTQLKDIYLVIYQDGQSYWPLNEISGSETNRLLNMEASMASVYLTQELRLTATFERISRELCGRNRDLILTSIQDYVNKILIAQDTQKAAGRYFVRAGSVLYSIKCVEQVAWLRGDTNECYDYAPIHYKDANDEVVSAYVDPVSYIIKPESSVRECNDILPYKLKIIALDGASEWICRNSNGWDVDCTAPQMLSPMHPNTLYTADDSAILTSLYSEEQLDTLANMQWRSTEKEVDQDEWDLFLQKIKRENPAISTSTYFENIKNSVEHISEIFSSSFWLGMILKHIMPLILVNYLVNVALNMVKATIFISKTYKQEGFSMSLVAKTPLALIASFFPVFSLSAFNNPQQTPKTCRCEDETFVEDLVDMIESRERQRFLRNLQL